MHGKKYRSHFNKMIWPQSDWYRSYCWRAEPAVFSITPSCSASSISCIVIAARLWTQPTFQVAGKCKCCFWLCLPPETGSIWQCKTFKVHVLLYLQTSFGVIVDSCFYIHIFIGSKKPSCFDVACRQATGAGRCLLGSAMEGEAEPHPCKITSVWTTLLDRTSSRKSDTFAYLSTADNGRKEQQAQVNSCNNKKG